ncbi:MAG: DUF2809 domain-containing protein [Cyanobacteria bacterium J06559_1]
MKAITRYRLLCSVCLGVLVALGLCSKFSGTTWGYAWVNDMAGDALYEIFWIWLVGSTKVCWRVGRIAIATFLVTATIECTQLIAFPEAWTAQLWWRLLLGTHFSWLDFIYYALGCTVGALSLIWLRARLGLARPLSQHSRLLPEKP